MEKSMKHLGRSCCFTVQLKCESLPATVGTRAFEKCGGGLKDGCYRSLEEECSGRVNEVE